MPRALWELAFVTMCGASVIGGCAPRSDVESRLANTIAIFEHHARHRAAFPEDFYANAAALAALRKATPRSLRVPELCMARTMHKDDGSVFLIARWLEAQPKAQDLYLLGKRDAEPIALAIDEMAGALENERDSKTAVIFTAVFVFPHDSEAALRIRESPTVHVVLGRNGLPVSNVFEVDRSRLEEPFPGAVPKEIRQ